MLFEQRTFTVAKDAGRPDENQDAVATDAERGVAAIADGVSSSLFAARWARLLVDAVVSDSPDVTDGRTFPDWLSGLRNRWLEGVDAGSLAWHQKPKFAEGAFATLLWVELTPLGIGEGCTLRAQAVGDCCLFHLHQLRVRRTFPMETSEQFVVDPAMIGSSEKQPVSKLQFETLEDECAAGDLLILATDAVAAWAVKQLEAGRATGLESLWEMTLEDFQRWIERIRGGQQIRYDDSTVLLLKIV